MGNQGTVVIEAEQFVKKLLTTGISEDHRYHNLEHTLKVRTAAVSLAQAMGCSPDEIEVLELASLFHDTGFTRSYEGHEAFSKDIAASFLQQQDYPENKVTQILELIEATFPPKYPSNLLEKIIKDADLSNLASKHYFDALEALRYEWTVFLNKHYTDEEWYKMNYKFVNTHEFYTTAAQEAYIKQCKANRKKLKALRTDKPSISGKSAKKNNDITGKHIPEGLIGKNKSAQMMFKTALRNHLDLSALADNKANTMLSVNALIITIVIPLAASYVSPERRYLLIPMIMLLLTCLVSMVFATLATRPIRMHGYTEKDEIEKGQSNLFFFGNFYKMKFTDYRDGMQNILAEDEKLDDSIMRDLFYLGTSLGTKYTQLRLCYTIFMWGIIITVVAFGIGYGLSNAFNQ
jgi:predicted metal-dependent HD superfamily phosphohydrolase